MRIASNEPWNDMFRKAKTGDKTAAHNLILATEPIIVSFYKVPVYRNRLGKDEIYSIAAYKLVRYFADHAALPPDREVPYLLHYIIDCELTTAIRKIQRREEKEQPPLPKRNDGSAETYTDAGGLDDTAAPDKAADPEENCMKSEMCAKVREAVLMLPENEKHLIHALFFQHKGMKEIAQELHCTFQNAYVMRKKAFTHLQKLLEPCVNA